MKFPSKLIQQQFAKVGRIFPKPTFNTNSRLDSDQQNLERKKQLI